MVVFHFSFAIHLPMCACYPSIANRLSHPSHDFNRRLPLLRFRKQSAKKRVSTWPSQAVAEEFANQKPAVCLAKFPKRQLRLSMTTGLQMIGMRSTTAMKLPMQPPEKQQQRGTRIMMTRPSPPLRCSQCLRASCLPLYENASWRLRSEFAPKLQSAAWNRSSHLAFRFGQLPSGPRATLASGSDRFLQQRSAFCLILPSYEAFFRTQEQQFAAHWTALC
mmetsp:Transcript_24049/g.46850  ORF Transcript_24049/g.46850 Transcript_24049/m.46850 type:complete len:220 (-) Transcript_24049:77-736(-)